MDARDTLRFILSELKIEQANAYRTHDMRRGHALDLQLSGTLTVVGASTGARSFGDVAGAPLYEILSASEWSPAFMQYLDYWRLEAAVVIQAHVEESDCDS